MAPRRQWIDKKSAAKFQLFHRSQNDPLVYDPEADDRVLYQVGGPKSDVISESASSTSHAPKQLADLEREFSTESIRKNEGEAANYGVFYDDTRYDYMQHLKELGSGGGNAHFVEARTPDLKQGKKAMKLEDALREVSLDDNRDLRSEYSYGGSARTASMYGGASTMSSYVRKPTYQDQQDIPDAIAGFQPDMDPRLRETLEALEDDAYVDNDVEDDEDIFGSLIENAEEIEPTEWEDTLFEHAEDDDGWESDVTEKAVTSTQETSHNDSNTTEPPPTAGLQQSPRKLDRAPLPENQEIPDTNPEDGAWLQEFAKFKKTGNPPANVTNQQIQTEVVSQHPTAAYGPASTIFTTGGTPIRSKKRKGALTNPSAYSMTSSSLARTEGLRLLDDRFERVEALYALDEEGEGSDDDFDGTASMVSGMTGNSGISGISQAPSLVSKSGDVSLRHDFEDVMDNFLAGWQDRSTQARRKGAKGKRGKNGNEVRGIQMLDEIRQGLGPARIVNSSSTVMDKDSEKV